MNILARGTVNNNGDSMKRLLKMLTFAAELCTVCTPVLFAVVTCVHCSPFFTLLLKLCSPDPNVNIYCININIHVYTENLVNKHLQLLHNC